MRMTEKGQVTIPIEMREQLGLMPGDEIEFHQEGDAVVLKRGRSTPSRGRRMVDLLRGSGDTEMTTDEIMELTRGE
ncbi:AbrB/MazE/SpoVT family DNA-binding domain-containing protein [Haloactinomyces albus]|uniref:AbrB family looped-hinge helix DNA binding protein n=1 Tax=Haloactinomyces albus TaxID=1352928 RepID=A0AAE3ZCF4_9ACTN|nr:AbrB/MazE/SpoVT family DNA-binding domain-containing protein [Haloactinomyces albus]MDR7300979.1 AbrB family looped-hinge helix DNA binding protein [Haloactinomyces albus]